MKSFHRLKKEVGHAILAKYNNKCTNCGSKENLCIHHVIKMKPNDENYNDIENLDKINMQPLEKKEMLFQIIYLQQEIHMEEEVKNLL